MKKPKPAHFQTPISGDASEVIPDLQDTLIPCLPDLAAKIHFRELQMLLYHLH